MAADSLAKSIFLEALELGDAERRALLDRRCAGDAGLREEVERLLAALDGAAREGFLGGKTAAGPREETIGARAGEGPGSMVGPYKILQKIGEGGFGSVFMAEQEEPVRRRVALKLIKLGMDTRQVIARFEAERQALAMMDHPNIARVLDAGATESGRPYFVMELVKGDPITEYCDKNNLPIVERLGLFAQVCRAVQHAHTKGVIHRDIKPGNVLVSTVDGRPAAKVIDFGIAKATAHRLTERTVFTEFRQLIGTPEYMSPEQAEGSLDIDTRTDVYSLGVLLYELLTGTTPFDPRTLRSAAYAEIQRIIREVDPPKPSTRVGTMKETVASVAAQRRTEPGRLSTTIRGDLDWIVMKSLEKDRMRRYEAAGALATDIERYLAGEAVNAAPPSAVYQVRKFVRRHRGPVLAAGVVAAALLAGLAGTAAGLVSAERERDRAIESERLATQKSEEAEKARADAEKARDEAQRMNKIASAVTEFFTQDLMDLPPTAAGERREPTVRDVLERAPEKITQYFSSEPAVEGVIRERIGQIYFNLGEVKKAEEFLVQAVPLLERGLSKENPQTLMALQRLAELYLETGRDVKAEDLFGQLHERRLKALGPEHPFTWNSLMRRAMVRAVLGRKDEAISDAERAYSEMKTRFGEGSRRALIFSVQLIECYRIAGKLSESEALARRMLDVISENSPEQAPAGPPHQMELARTLLAMGRGEEAFEQAREAIGPFENSYRKGLPKLVEAQVTYAQTMAAAGRPADALPRLAEAYASFVRTYGATSPQAREVAGVIAGVCEQLKDADGAASWRGKAAPPPALGSEP